MNSAFWGGPDKHSFSNQEAPTESTPTAPGESSGVDPSLDINVPIPLPLPITVPIPTEPASEPQVFDILSSNGWDMGQQEETTNTHSLLSELRPFTAFTEPLVQQHDRREREYGLVEYPTFLASHHPTVTFPVSVESTTPPPSAYYFIPQSTESPALPISLVHTASAIQLDHPPPITLVQSLPPPLLPPTSSTATTSPPPPLPVQVESTTPVKRGKRQVRQREKPSEEEKAYYGLTDPVCRVPQCLVCARNLPDSLRVPQPSWASILRIVFYTLKFNYPHKDFFNLRSHVYDFVEAHWQKICIGKTKSDHWKKQLQDTLAHNKRLFTSGADIFKQKGFWRLDDLSDPWEESAQFRHSSGSSTASECGDNDGTDDKGGRPKRARGGYKRAKTG